MERTLIFLALLALGVGGYFSIRGIFYGVSARLPGEKAVCIIWAERTWERYVVDVKLVVISERETRFSISGATKTWFLGRLKNAYE